MYLVERHYTERERREAKQILAKAQKKERRWFMKNPRRTMYIRHSLKGEYEAALTVDGLYDPRIETTRVPWLTLVSRSRQAGLSHSYFASDLNLEVLGEMETYVAGQVLSEMSQWGLEAGEAATDFDFIDHYNAKMACVAPFNSCVVH